MGKRFNFTKKMNVSKDILWGIVKNHNSHLYKTKTVQLTKDPLSATNCHSLRNCGLVSDKPVTGVSNAGLVNKTNKVRLVQSHKRNFVFKGVGSKRRTGHGAKYSTSVANAKNAINSVKCPVVKKRISRLHKANAKGLRKTKAASN